MPMGGHTHTHTINNKNTHMQNKVYLVMLRGFEETGNNIGW